MGCNSADIAEPCSILDPADIHLFIQGFLDQASFADFAAPFGVWDLADVQLFIAPFAKGCP